MLPPGSIDFLQTLTRQGGGHLCWKDGQQLLVPFFEGSSSVSLTVTPPDGTYAALVYRITFGQTLPNMFIAEFTHSGTRPLGGIVTADVSREGLYVFVPLTEGEPLRVRLINRDVIAHIYEQNISYLGFANSADWESAKVAMEIRYGLRLLPQQKARPPEEMPPPPYVPLASLSESRRSLSPAPQYTIVERPR